MCGCGRWEEREGGRWEVGEEDVQSCAVVTGGDVRSVEEVTVVMSEVGNQWEEVEVVGVLFQ